MKRCILYIILFALIIPACSTKKNTAARRAYHEMKVIHNVYFNGVIAYNEGLQAIDKAGEDDFTDVLNLYPISGKKAQQAATSQMDKSIEKCRKSIKLHSIHAKPKRNAKKMKNPKYRAWLQNKEFNNQMIRAWMLLGQSEFHKGDFLGSIGTFSYISRLYENDKDVVAQCQLWMARAYGEMGWQYEAEDILHRVKVDDLKRKHQSLYAAVTADVLLKSRRYKEAMPFVKTARKDEKRSLYRPRFEYVLGQLYEIEGQNEPARSAYKRVIRMQPAPEMVFNARLRYYALAGDTLKTVKHLRKMAKLPKNKDLLDQIYGTVGNLYLQNGDTATALLYYQKAIAESTRNGQDKAAILLMAGQLYYEQSRYLEAAPCYKEAVQILSHEDQRYLPASKRAETLEKVVAEENTVTLQDSLQYLSTLSEDEQRLIAEEIVKQLIASEQADSIQEQQSARERELNSEGPGRVDASKMFGSNRDNSWYFYNSQLLKNGKQEFAKRWGNRELEDNWRRKSKTFTTTTNSEDNADNDVDNDFADNDAAENPIDSLNTSPSPAKTPVTDNHNPEYYLQQIPRTAEDINASNRQIADALYHLVALYRDELSDIPKSTYAYDEFRRRFPEEERTVELIYRQFLAAQKDGREEDVQRYRNELVTLFPESIQARIASDPTYIASLRATEALQDSLYALTYKAFRKGNYKEVKARKEQAEQECAMSPLMPRFLFLNAIGSARTQGQKAFTADLKEMVERYPDHELSAMAKKMLALMGEGMESQKGGALNSLQTQREQQAIPATAENDTTDGFKREQNETSYVLVVIPHNNDSLNQLLYQVALFNFTQFLIRDFDLQIVANLSDKYSALQISGFETMDEARWYINLLKQDPEVMILLTNPNDPLLPITVSNYQLLGTHSLDEYRLFMQTPQNPTKKPAPTKNTKKQSKNKNKNKNKKKK